MFVLQKFSITYDIKQILNDLHNNNQGPLFLEFNSKIKLQDQVI